MRTIGAFLCVVAFATASLAAEPAAPFEKGQAVTLTASGERGEVTLVFAPQRQLVVRLARGNVAVKFDEVKPVASETVTAKVSPLTGSETTTASALAPSAPPAVATIPSPPPAPPEPPAPAPPPPLVTPESGTAPGVTLRTSRIGSSFAMFGASVGMTLVGATAGGLLGHAISPAKSPCYFICFGGEVVGAPVGALLGLPLGVWLAGHAFDANGSLWAALAGEVVGIGGSVALGLAAGAVASSQASGLMNFLIVAAILSPFAGAIIGYELTALPIAPELTPSLSLGPGGSASFGVSGRF